jgi:UDPglucose 6-dehydrogenase
MIHIAVIGTGYVGLTTGAGLAEFGHAVHCIDRDAARIQALARGIVPLYEPGLDVLVARNIAEGRLEFSQDTEAAVAGCDVVFLTVGTPVSPSGEADLSHLEEAARQTGRGMRGCRTVVVKSTVPPGGCRHVRSWIEAERSSRADAADFEVVANPEFLREGSAVEDFLRPDRVVLGLESERAKATMREIYRPLLEASVPFVETGIQSAEMIKHASNAFLAVKLSFINEIAALCERVGADIGQVARGMGFDPRIGASYLAAGPGYGGSCLRKDSLALSHAAATMQTPLTVIHAAVTANEAQKRRMIDKIEAASGDLAGRTVAVLGLAFKAGTDDVRDAPALDIIAGLTDRHARVRAFDPAAMPEARNNLQHLGEQVQFCTDEYDAARDADILVIVTEWKRFATLDLARLASLMRGRILCDLRNLYVSEDIVGYGFTHIGVGR